jgi:hypothetical protein
MSVPKEAAMTSHIGRLYALALAVLVFSLAWALVAARPWQRATPSAADQLLALREQALRRETTLVNAILRQRAAAARRDQQQLASTPPPVRVVTLPPLTITRTS